MGPQQKYYIKDLSGMVSNRRQVQLFKAFAGTQTGNENTVPDPKVTHGLLGGMYKMVQMGFKAGHTLFHQGVSTRAETSYSKTGYTEGL